MNWRPPLLALALGIGCTSGVVEQRHEACDLSDEDRRCTVDEDCAYLGTYVEKGECCYDACGGGSVVNRQAIERLERAREPLTRAREFSRCDDHGGDVKCDYGRVYCNDGFCEQTHQALK